MTFREDGNEERRIGKQAWINFEIIKNDYKFSDGTFFILFWPIDAKR